MSKKSINWRLLAGLLFAAIAIVFIISQWDSLQKSLDALKEAKVAYIAISAVTFALSVVAAAAIVYNLRLKPKLKYLHVLAVQTAGLFLGRITPASIGGIAAMIRHLTTAGHSVAQATTVMGAAAISTFIGNISLTIVALILASRTLELDSFELPGFMLILVMLIVVIASLILIFSQSLRDKIIGFIKDIYENLKKYKSKKMSLLRAIVLGAFLTLMYGLTMMLVAYSLGVELSLFVAIISISIGSLGVAVTPLPGGAVGAEAAIAATLVQFGVTTEVSVAIALVYRAITFWIPLLPGFLASQYSLKKEYL